MKTFLGVLLALAFVLKVGSGRRARCLKVVATLSHEAARKLVGRKLGSKGLRHVEDAEAIVVETLATAEFKFTLQTEAQAKGWWNTCIYHKVIDLLRTDQPVIDPTGDKAPVGADVTNRLGAALDVLEAVESLPWPKREIVKLRDLMGIKWDAVAAAVGLPQTTAFILREQALVQLGLKLAVYA
ncbi:hypothetical protein EDM80_08165 [bacterium]|nr:MAG: hypothetical protein EDM80_08165 [bacterium]MCQ3951045.1 hypothetical protein [Planctomycetota bacterium]RIK60808.1 MAG: hypothetical protein DCC64_14160 [Planctomycetota bacterium]